jgi:hypothetical protein
MSDLLQQALRGARHEGAALLAPRQALLVLGAGGALGSAVLAETLVAGRFREVSALVALPLASTLRGLKALTQAQLDSAEGPRFDAAIVVFDRERRSNGRDDAFAMPEPALLLPLARALIARGVRRLVVVMPHAPALLPQALAQGLASLDETTLAGLGFEHLVLLRAARSEGSPDAAGGWMARVARLWLAQMRFMIPERQQPLRTTSLARCIAELVRVLPESEPGTRVVAPETLWQWVQALDAGARERG